jgi:hypothetical protein
MKIVKQFEDPDFYNRLSKNYEDIYHKWIWGLGNDGELYFLSEGLTFHNWISYRKCVKEGTEIFLSFQDMKKLVKEFGHLIIFT